MLDLLSLLSAKDFSDVTNLSDFRRSPRLPGNVSFIVAFRELHGLLPLLMCRYWPLLAAMPTSATPNGAHHEESCLKFVFACLSSPKASQKVCECVVGMVVSLLTLGRDDRDEKGSEDRIAGGIRAKGAGKRRGGGVEAMDTGATEGVGDESDKGRGDGRVGVRKLNAESTWKEGREEEEVEAVDADGKGRSGGEEMKEGHEKRVEAMETEEGGAGGTSRSPSGEEMVAPFISCLLSYLNRVIRENVGKAGRVKERGRSLDSEFVMLSR